MKAIKRVWDTVSRKVADSLRCDVDERNRAHNSKVDTRQATRAWLRDQAYAEMRRLKVPRKVQRTMARAKAKREWQESKV